jgi:hypothetical protein
MKAILLILSVLTLQACAYSREFTQKNPDGSNSVYQFVHDVDIAGPNTVVVRVHDCVDTGEPPLNCKTRDPQVGYGNGVLEQVVQPAAMVGAAVLWPSDNVTATGGSTSSSAAGGSASSSATSSAASSSSGTKPKPHK